VIYDLSCQADGTSYDLGQRGMGVLHPELLRTHIFVSVDRT